MIAYSSDSEAPRGGGTSDAVAELKLDYTPPTSTEPTSDDKIEQIVIEAIRTHLALRTRLITTRSTFERDLGCTGDDAVELLLWFQREFEVDLSKMQFMLHFHDEAWSLPSPGLPLLVGLGASVVAAAVVDLGAKFLGMRQANCCNSVWLLAVMVPSFIFGVWGGWRFWGRPWPDPCTIPATVGHFVEAARLRRWPMSYVERMATD